MSALISGCDSIFASYGYLEHWGIFLPSFEAGDVGLSIRAISNSQYYGSKYGQHHDILHENFGIYAIAIFQASVYLSLLQILVAEFSSCSK
jgi:hypothetical protein